MKYKPLIPEAVFIHCASTPPSMDIGVAEITRWHREKGWFGIGYHFVIRRDGTIENGRDINKPGAHARGHNHYSIGICLVGGATPEQVPENNFTTEQFRALEELLLRLVTQADIHTIIGHRDVPGVKKACPSFDVTEWLSDDTGPGCGMRTIIAQNCYTNSLNYD